MVSILLKKTDFDWSVYKDFKLDILNKTGVFFGLKGKDKKDYPEIISKIKSVFEFWDNNFIVNDPMDPNNKDEYKLYLKWENNINATIEELQEASR